MKSKDIFYLVVAVGIFLAAGYLAYTQLLPKKTASTGQQVEVVGTIDSSLDQTGMQWLNDQTHVHDFDSPVDLTGLGNPAPFGN